MKEIICNDCGARYEGEDVSQCRECGSEEIEVYYDPGERPKQSDEAGYLHYVNSVGAW